MSIMSVAQTLWNGHRSENDFSLPAHLTQCIEQCSNICSDHPQVTLTCDDRVPDVVNGDLDMLMLAIQTLTEFSLRYTSISNQSAKIGINTSFDKFKEDEKSFFASFQFRMPVNQNYDTKKIKKLFSDMSLDRAFQTDDINAYFLQRSISFGEY